MPSDATLPLECSRLIVCEKTGEWANSLRCWLADNGRWLVETRGFQQLAAALTDHPTSLCVVAVTNENAIRVADTIEQNHHRFPQANFIAACEQENTELAAALREAGAAYVTDSRRDTDIIDQLWQQHCRHHPPREQTLRDEIFAALPWS